MSRFLVPSATVASVTKSSLASSCAPGNESLSSTGSLLPHEMSASFTRSSSATIARMPVSATMAHRSAYCRRSSLCSLSSNSSSMVGSSRKCLVVSTPKHTRLEPTAQHPWRPDPADNRTPIAPPDTASMHRRALGFVCQVRQVVRRQVRLQLQASKHAAQQIVADFDAVRDRLADGLGLPQKGFGFRHFHGSNVSGGLSNKYVQGACA